MSLLLVRHAVAVSKHDWPSDDRLRPLNDKGFAQARALVDVLAGHRIEVIVSSPAVRCVQTVEPLAAALGLEVVEDAVLWESMPLAPVRRTHQLRFKWRDAAVQDCDPARTAPGRR